MQDLLVLLLMQGVAREVMFDVLPEMIRDADQVVMCVAALEMIQDEDRAVPLEARDRQPIPVHVPPFVVGLRRHRLLHPKHHAPRLNNSKLISAASVQSDAKSAAVRITVVLDRVHLHQLLDQDALLQ